jgi:hypothetical protein
MKLHLLILLQGYTRLRHRTISLDPPIESFETKISPGYTHNILYLDLDIAESQNDDGESKAK